MGYQYIENLKNARICVIREYEDMEASNLPDERFQLKLTYYTQAQLKVERVAFDRQYAEIKKEVERVWDVVEELYQSNKTKSTADFNDLANKLVGSIKKRKIRQGLEHEDYVVAEKEWNEIVFIKSQDTAIDKENRPYLHEKEELRKRFVIMRDKIFRIYKNQNPIDRVSVEERLDFLEREYTKFDYMINPYHIQPGVLLDIDITSIKRKKYTLNAMANVLNEFLHGVSKGFQDAAFASFSRRRSTIRQDINQSFGTTEEDEAGYQMDFLEETTTSEAPEGIVDVSKEDDGLTEI